MTHNYAVSQHNLKGLAKCAKCQKNASYAVRKLDTDAVVFLCKKHYLAHPSSKE